MIITCEECDSSFVLDDRLLKPSGSKVRCTSCRNIFVAYPGQPDPKPPAPVVRKKVSAKKTIKKKETPVQVAELPIEPSSDDPDLTKAVNQIVEGELVFSDEELNIKPAPKSKPVVEEVPDEIPAIEVDDAEDDEEILDFSDFELDMEESDLPVQSTDDFTVVDDDDDLDFSDLDDELSADQQVNAGDELDLQLDAEEENLDLELSFDDDGDLNLDIEEDIEPDLPVDPVESFDDELDFSDLELELDDDAASPPEIEEPGTVDDLQFDFDLEEDPEEPGTVDDLDLDLDFDSGDEPETLMVEDEFDFSDLEAELDDNTQDGPAEIEDLDLDLDLDMDEPGTMALDDDDLDLSDFELDLDLDEEPPAVPVNDEPELSFTEDDSPIDEELDFSDLAGMLENDLPAQDTPSADDDDLDLDLDLALDDDGDPELATEAPAQAKADGNEELDFSDLENILDTVESEDTPGINNRPDEDIELELDLDMDDGLDDDLELSADDINDDESFDFSDVEAMLEADDNLDEGEDLELDFDDADDDLADIDFGDDGDMDLQLSMEDDELEDTISFDEIGTKEKVASEDIDSASIDKTMRVAKDKKKPKKVKPKRRASGKGKLIIKLFFLIILLLVITLGVFLSRGKIDNATQFKLPEIAPVEDLRKIIIDADIPFISDWVRIKPKDPKGINDLSVSNITSDYVTNEVIGADIYVIKGKIQNGYANTRNSLSLKCSLKNAGGQIIKSKIFYAGHDIEESKLKTIDIDSLNRIIKKRLGTDNTNAKVRPGQILPFTVVFSDITDEVTDFLVEPASSFQGAAMK